MAKENKTRSDIFGMFLAVLLFGLLLRVLFAPGVGFENSFDVIRGSSSIASALKPLSLGHFLASLPQLRAELGWPRIMAELPLAIIYAVFGYSDHVTRTFGLLCSLFGLLIIYGIARQMTGREIAGQNTALLAIAIFALIPIDIFASGTPTHATFWFPITLLVAYLFESILRRKAAIPALFLLVTAFYLLVIQFWLGFFVLIFWVAKLVDIRWPYRGIWLPISIILVAATAITVVFWDELHAWRSAMLEPGMYLLVPLFLVALVSALLRPSRTKAAFLWLICALAALLGSLLTGSPPADLLAAGLLIAVGVCIVIGDYLANLLDRPIPFSAAALYLAATLGAAYFGLRAQSELIPSFEGFRWLGFHSIFLFSNIIGGLFIVFLFASAAIWKNKKASLVGFLALTLFPFAMLSPIWQKTLPFQTLTNAVKAAASALDDLDIPLRVYITEPQLRDLLAYYEAENGGSFRIVQQRWDGPDRINDGYILGPEGKIQDVPESWLKINTFGQLNAPTRLVLYRSLTPKSAAEELQVASTLVTQDPTAEHYRRYYEALINTGQYCNAYEAWMEARELFGGTSSSIPVRADLDCFGASSKSGETQQFDTLTALVHYPGYIRVGLLNVDEAGNPIWRVFRRYEGYYDPRIFDLRTSLDQNAFYLYSANVRGELRDPFYTLYWRIGDREDYLDKNLYPEWTRVSLLIYTGESDEALVEMRFSPVLSDNFGTMFLSQVQISRISSTP
jgi:hypothetical protein